MRSVPGSAGGLAVSDVRVPDDLSTVDAAMDTFDEPARRFARTVKVLNDQLKGVPDRQWLIRHYVLSTLFPGSGVEWEDE